MRVIKEAQSYSFSESHSDRVRFDGYNYMFSWLIFPSRFDIQFILAVLSASEASHNPTNYAGYLPFKIVSFGEADFPGETDKM